MSAATGGSADDRLRPRRDESLPHPVIGEPFQSPVPPGRGWPGDLADVTTPVAQDPPGVEALATSCGTLDELTAAMSVCRACPRLVAWREEVAVTKRRSFEGEPYWGRPITGWGSETPSVLIIGLAPAAQGGNRTGRIFTGDRSGDWLYASLHRSGLAVQQRSDHAGDGQQLIRTRMLAVVRCAPPGNAPTPRERDVCNPWLDAELRLTLTTTRVVVCLGLFAWDNLLRALGRLGQPMPRPRPRFSHGVRLSLDGLDVLGCYHPSQQNTFTGKLTEAMLDKVLAEAAAYL